MKDWSRRNLLRATAGAAVGAAVAVPMTALSGTASAAEPPEPSEFSGLSGGGGSADSAGIGPVMFCVHDAQRAEVSILHGTNEVIVTDRQLVHRILQAAGSRLS
jgi:hypothetical protein